MLSFKENPPIKPTHVSTLGEVRGEWFVGHAKARNEKAFAWELVRRNVPHFLPMVEKVTFSGGRRRRNMTPLFPGYVFFAGDGDTRHVALGTDRLCRVIPIADQIGFISEICQVDVVLTCGSPVDYFPHAAVGNAVRVTAGPFVGVTGVVVAHEPADTQRVEDGLLVVISISVLGTGVSVRVPPSLLEKIDVTKQTRPVRLPSFERVEPERRVLRGKQASRPVARDAGEPGDRDLGDRHLVGVLK